MVANHIQQLVDQYSWITDMFEEGRLLKKQLGAENVFDFTLGNPEQQPPDLFYHRLKDLAVNPIPGLHRYMSNQGLSSTRKIVAKHYSKELNCNLSEKDVIMTASCSGGLNIALKALLNPGDEVIVFTPTFSEYQFYIDTHGGTLIEVPTDDQFLPDLKAFEASLTEKTKIVIINTPNNPTGVIYPEKMLQQIANLLNDHNKHNQPVYIISDEPYRKLIYDEISLPSIFDYYPFSIVAICHSKDLALAGERIGYLILHPGLPDKKELMSAMTFCNRILGFINAPAMMQYLIEGLLTTSVNIELYRKKRDFLYHELTQIGFKIVKPSGAFYLFPEHPMKNDIEWVNHLRKFNILVAPGIGFKRSGYFRISYAVTFQTITKSIPLFQKAFNSIPF